MTLNGAGYIYALIFECIYSKINVLRPEGKVCGSKTDDVNRYVRLQEVIANDSIRRIKTGKSILFFEKLCEIPHGSTNMKEISDYLVSFAKERNLKYYQDEAYNVVIYKEASAGYEDAPITILQGHCDMVAEKTPDSNHDFTKDGLKLKVEGDYLTAEEQPLAVMTESLLPICWQFWMMIH